MTKNQQKNNTFKDAVARKMSCWQAAGPSTKFIPSAIEGLRTSPWTGFRTGQVVLEYALLVAVVAAAFIAMSFYVKRAVQGSITMIESKGVIAKAERLSHYHHDDPPVPA